ncbi:MAG TPA: tetratricopeptide repeat protein [Candidatus Lustribacter sp.]|nr:tetratricopeptide repeat protein [Candidatus Lustribacter sp.]
MIRFRLPVLIVAGAIVAIAAVTSHQAGAATKAAPSPSPSAAPAPSATPEPLDHAIPRLEAALKANPDDKDAMTELAGDYLNVNRPDLSQQLTQKLLTGGTKNAQIYFIDGTAQGMLGKSDEGIASMEQAANLEPTNMMVLQSLTQMYVRANRPADAERVARRALTFNANSKDAGLNLGFVLAVEKKYDEARAQFEAVAKLDPKDPHPLVLEARTYEDASSLALAMPLLDRALAIDPKDLEALAAKAELASAMHDVKTSIATYELIFAQAQDNDGKVAVVDQEALVYAREKQDTDADATFRKAIDNYGTPTSHLAYGDYLASKNDKAGALREWTVALGANRDNPQALARLGQAAAESNDFSKAADNYKRLTEVDTNDPQAYMLYGQALLANKNATAARDAFKASFNLNHTPDALVGLAAADQETRNFTEAIQIYEALDKNAAAVVKANPGILFSMASAYKGANDVKNERATLVRFLAFLKPGTQGYTQIQQMIAQIDHPSAAKPAAKPSPKPSAKPTPSH